MTLGHSPSIVTNGLVLCLDAGNANSYPRSGTTWTDISGNGNTGTLTNGPTFDVGNGGSIVFDGTNKYVGIASSSNSTQAGATSFSVEFWVKKAAQNTNFLAGPYNVTTSIGWSVHWNRVSDELYFYAGDGTLRYNRYSLPWTSNWFNIVAVFNGALSGSANIAKMYVNSQQLTANFNSNGMYTSVPVTMPAFLIGNLVGYAEQTTGNVAIAKIYNRALSDAEITQNYNALSARYASTIPVSADLLLYLDAGNPSSYPGTGTTWTDLSGRGNNGTLVNGPTYSSANNGSIVFDGVDDYVSLPAGLLSGTSDFTINQWVKSSSVGNTGTIFANYPSGNLQMLYGNQYVGVYLGTPVYACSTTPCVHYTSSWCMITALRSGTSVQFYRNGILIASGTTSNSVGTGAATFRLGTNTSTTERYTGNISINQVYSRALSVAEIAQNFDAFRGRYGI